jgi:hypothetical protein
MVFRFTLLTAIALIAVVTQAEEPTPQASSSYAPSPVIKGVVIEPQRQSLGNGDNWPITWADDGDQYTVYCDGKGFGGSGDRSMSLATITGSPPNVLGHNISSPTAQATGGDKKGRKAAGLLMVDGVLYMWVRNLNQDGTGSTLAWSKDHARTWTWADWNFSEIGYPVWLNAGKNYEAAQDGYAYLYSPDTPSAYKPSDNILLVRVPKDRITDKQAYQFFSGMNNHGQPRWSAEFRDRKPVFTASGHCYRPDVVYNPGIRRYLLCTATSGSKQWCGTEGKYLGIFDAPTPWGPWTMVTQIDGWGGDENWFQPRIPSKWISEDGKTFDLLYSCFPKGPYQFNLQRCTIQEATTSPGLSLAKKKAADRIEVNVEGDTAIIDVFSQSGIGGATITTTRERWPSSIVLRLHLSGLESVAVSNGKVKLTGSVLSHSGNTKRLYLTEEGQDGEREPGTEIKVLDAAGKPITGLPGKDGYFEIMLPKALLEGQPKSLDLGWIDFYRR